MEMQKVNNEIREKIEEWCNQYPDTDYYEEPGSGTQTKCSDIREFSEMIIKSENKIELLGLTKNENYQGGRIKALKMLAIKKVQTI